MKKIFYTMAVAAAVFAGYSAYDAQNENDLANVVLDNVEALAREEIIFADLCMHVPNNWCIYMWDDGTVDDDIEGIFVKD